MILLFHTSTSHLQRIRMSTLFQCQVVTNDSLLGLGWLVDEGRGLFSHPSVQVGLLEADEHRLTPHVRVIAVWTAHNKDRYVHLYATQLQ